MSQRMLLQQLRCLTNTTVAQPLLRTTIFPPVTSNICRVDHHLQRTYHSSQYSRGLKECSSQLRNSTPMPYWPPLTRHNSHSFTAPDTYLIYRLHSPPPKHTVGVLYCFVTDVILTGLFVQNAPMSVLEW